MNDVTHTAVLFRLWVVAAPDVPTPSPLESNVHRATALHWFCTGLTLSAKSGEMVYPRNELHAAGRSNG